MGRLWPCSTSGELQAHQACWAARRRMEQVKLGNISCEVGGESDRVRYIHQESAGVWSFDVCCNEWDVMKRGRGDLVWSDFTFTVFSPFGFFSRSWIKKFLGHLETFGASSKDQLPKRFMYRKLMPDIFCHQEPQIQIKCQKIHHLFMSYIFETCYFLIDPVNCCSFRPSVFWCNGTVLPWSFDSLLFLSSGCRSAAVNLKKPSTTLNSHQQLSTTFEMHQELRLSGYANADTPSAELVKWQREEQQPLPPCPTTQQNTCFFCSPCSCWFLGRIRFKLESTHFFQGVPVEISGGHIGIWLRLLLRDSNSMLPTLPVWQAAHGFGSEQNKNCHSMALNVRLQLWFLPTKILFLVTFHPCPG